jgi:ribonuclease P protein component
MRAFASLRRSGDFNRLRQRGRRTATDALTIFRDHAREYDTASLVGISVNKAVGKAVVRNRVRRRLLAILQEMLPGRESFRLLIVARPTAAGATFSDLRSQVGTALR